MTTTIALLLLLVIELVNYKFEIVNTLNKLRSYRVVEQYYTACWKLWVKFDLPTNKLFYLASSLLLLISVYILQVFTSLLFGFLGSVIFSCLILLYCLGHINYDNRDSIFIYKHEQAFAVIFWFLLLGPIGAVMYRWLVISRLCVVKLDNKVNKQIIDFVHGLAAWLPARITGFIYAVVGDFVSGIKCWRECMAESNMHSSTVLANCGNAALGNWPESEKTDLVYRAFIVWIILSILIALLV